MYCLKTDLSDNVTGLEVYWLQTRLELAFTESNFISVREEIPGTAADLLTRIINTGWHHCTIYHRFYIDFINYVIS